jgi:hypothetical protein
MADEPQTLRSINWRETFPFTHLFRAFRVAVHPSKLVLGLVLLLSIYAGGRLLDSLWPARYLALPEEVRMYEQSRLHDTGVQSFAEGRRSARAELEADYAQRLLAEKVETDPAEAAREARSGGELDDLKKNIVTRRDEAVTAAAKARDEARNAARSLNGKPREDAERAAETTYSDAVRMAYRAAYQDYRSLKHINGVGLFHALFEYESAQILNVVRSVLSLNFFGGWDDLDSPGVIRSIMNFFVVGPLWLMRYHPVYFVLFSLMFLTLWAIFGGAIATRSYRSARPFNSRLASSSRSSPPPSSR